MDTRELLKKSFEKAKNDSSHVNLLELISMMSAYLLREYYDSHNIKYEIKELCIEKFSKPLDDRPVNCKEFCEIFSIEGKPVISEARLAMHLGLLKDFLGEAVSQAGPKHHFRIYPKKLLEIATSSAFPNCEFKNAVLLFLEKNRGVDGIPQNS